ncbi:MAG: hypothetical protein JXB49_36555 [Bacteroidales bacterium]|nr:hypothetical protein [Bacteroidales bacterium]
MTDEKKRNPGHYVAVGPNFDISTLQYLDEPAIVGVNKRYNWCDLEPEKDVYDLSSIENDLEYLVSHKKQLVVFFIDRSFWIKGAMPSYLSEYELEANGYGYTNLRWYPEVMNRFVKICTEIGRKFDSNKHFEGIALQESSLDLKQSDYEKYNYTAVKYRNSIIYILKNLRKGLPKSNIFWYGNFIPGDWEGKNIRKVLDNITNLDISYGVPDILPYHEGYNQSTYKIFEEYKDKIVLFACAQDDSYRHHKNDISHEYEEPLHEDGYLSMEKIFLFGRDHLYLKYIFWNYFYEEAKEGQRTYDDAIEVIHRNPIFNP